MSAWQCPSVALLNANLGEVLHCNGQHAASLSPERGIIHTSDPVHGYPWIWFDDQAINPISAMPDDA